jgi:hypothetical protein
LTRTLPLTTSRPPLSPATPPISFQGEFCLYIDATRRRLLSVATTNEQPMQQPTRRQLITWMSIIVMTSDYELPKSNVLPSDVLTWIHFRRDCRHGAVTGEGCNGGCISVHHHGMTSQPAFDGWANDMTCPGEWKDYVYSNDNGGARNDWQGRGVIGVLWGCDGSHGVS